MSKVYIKFYWDCGFAGTDGYEIVEYDKMPTDEELFAESRRYHEENCGEYHHKEVTKKEFDEQEN